MKSYVVARNDNDGKTTGYASNVNGQAAQIVELLEEAEPINQLVLARQLAGALQKFDADNEYRVLPVDVTIKILKD